MPVEASVSGGCLRKTRMRPGADRHAVDAFEQVFCRDSMEATEHVAVAVSSAIVCHGRPKLGWPASPRGARTRSGSPANGEARWGCLMAGRDQVMESGEEGGNAAGK